jgi:lipopolysaccharide export system protein LptA
MTARLSRLGRPALAALACAALLLTLGRCAPSEQVRRGEAPGARAPSAPAGPDSLPSGPRGVSGRLLPDTLEGLAAPVVVPVAPDTTLRARRSPAGRPDTAAPPLRTAGPAPAADTARGSGRARVRADSLSAYRRDGERVQELFGNVFVQQDSTRLRSQTALRSLDRQTFLFVGDVRVYQRGDTLYADTVRYDKRTKVGNAFGNVRLTDGQVDVYAPEAVYYTEDKRSVFPDSLRLVDSTRVLRARAGEYLSEEKRAEFYGNVRMTDPETDMTADSVTYLRDEEVSVARGQVRIERKPPPDRAARADTAGRTYLFGDRARNEEARRYSRIEGQARLLQLRTDSTGAPSDTLVVRAQVLEAMRTDSLRRLIGVGKVEIWKPDLAAAADSVVYDRERPPPDSTVPPRPLTERPAAAPPSGRRSDPSAVAPVRPAGLQPLPIRPPAGLALQSPTLQSPTLRPTEGTPVKADSTPRRGPPPAWARALQSAARTGSAEAPSARRDAQRREEIRLYRTPSIWLERSQISGDTVRVVATNRSVDTVFVRSNAFVASRDTTIDRINQLKGRRITAYFRADSLRRIYARPNAEAIRFRVENGAVAGAAKASADWVNVWFLGPITRIKFGSGVQSESYINAGDVPSPFRLEGFLWTPEERLRRRDLRRDEQLRPFFRRPQMPRPPLAEGAPAAGPASGSAPGPASGPASAARPDSLAAPLGRGAVVPDTARSDPARAGATEEATEGDTEGDTVRPGTVQTDSAGSNRPDAPSEEEGSGGGLRGAGSAGPDRTSRDLGDGRLRRPIGRASRRRLPRGTSPGPDGQGPAARSPESAFRHRTEPPTPDFQPHP